MSATSLCMVPYGEGLPVEGPVWWIGVVVCLLTAAEGPIQLSLSACNGWPHCAAAPLALANQLPLPRL